MKFTFLDRLLGALGGKKVKKKKRKGVAKRKPGGKTRRSLSPTVELTGAVPAAPVAPVPEPVPAPAATASSLDEFIDQLGSQAPEPAPDPAPQPVMMETVVPVAEPEAFELPEAPPSELEQLFRSGDAAAIAQTIETSVASARSLRRFAQEKQALFVSYQAQLDRAIQVRDFMTLGFVGSSLIVDASFFRDELLTVAGQITDLADKLLAMPPKKAQAQAAELQGLLETLHASITKKFAMIETLDGKLIKAHQAKDFATMSDMTGALSRDALILASLDTKADDIAASNQTGLTATSSSEKAAQIDQQVAQLHQAVLDRKFTAIADIARIVSLNAGVLADPSTSKAAQILQIGQQLQAAMKASPENPGNVALCANLSKVASVFNGPLMDKANQLEGQVSQLQAALKAFDQNKMFTLAVTIARSAAILTDATIQKASLLAGYVPRIDVSIKRKDFQGAVSALKSALS